MVSLSRPEGKTVLPNIEGILLLQTRPSTKPIGVERPVPVGGFVRTDSAHHQAPPRVWGCVRRTTKRARIDGKPSAQNIVATIPTQVEPVHNSLLSRNHFLDRAI